MASGAMEEIPPHPYLTEPILYVSNLPAHITDEVIARTLEFCVPFRPRLVRDPASGTASGSIEFRTIERAEKALATLDGRQMAQAYPPVILNLDPTPQSTSSTHNWPPPAASPRIISNLPPAFSDSRLFDTFRVFGAIASCRMNADMGPDVGIITFWREEDAARMEEGMHMGDIDDYTISIKSLSARDMRKHKGLEFNPQAPSFVPSGMPQGPPQAHPVQPTPQAGWVSPSLRHASPPLQPFTLSPMPSPHLPLGNNSPMMMPAQALPLMYSPPRVPMQFPRSPSLSPFVHGPGQQVQYAPATGPGSTSASGLIDPCNLFCKFGHIVSARIMRNEHGQSRGFGFVSFQTPEQAARALQAMNGALLGSKQIVVRLHEPKQLRKEKLAQRFAAGHGHNGHPRSGSGATSPTMSEVGDNASAYGSWSPGIPGRDRQRRGSGSYYQAALSGTLHVPLSYEELAGMSPVVRHEVLSGELMRRLRSFPEVKEEEISAICQGSPRFLRASVRDAGPGTHPGFGVPLNVAASHSTSTLLDPSTLAATASAPEHPSTPVSFTPSINTPPRTASPTGSIAPGTEKERLLAAVSALEPARYKADPTKAADITEMLLSLSKKERAMCLFSNEYLRGKVENARNILDALAEEDEPTPAATNSATNMMSKLTLNNNGGPATPQQQHRAPASSAAQQTPQTPDLSVGTSTTTSPAFPQTPAESNTSSTGHTLATLAKLPAVEVLKLASSGQATGLPLPKADPSVVSNTDQFVDSLNDKPIAVQKQLLGEKLFKTVKSFGVRNAPKVTINLLDTEDLRSLAHLMNSYPALLKEKVLQLTVPR
ncbi:SubName: Full=Related to protein mediates microtubule-dependent mRNA transport {ECO:0000313/EMBL:CCA67340.1} [Serendipita indica DSM 11827]|nr:SubName: Full=Related to protein mediates microtubule-dependent mRNA transport {ECO:0000313/EMBL:CCA67340.1} [Serendipita indica DSM 11827]